MATITERIITRLDGVSNERLTEVLEEMNEARTQEISALNESRTQEITDLTADLDDRVNRAFEAGFLDGAGNDDPAQGDFKAGGQGYKRLSDNYVRDGKIDFKRALEVAWDLWQKSPIAKRVLTMKRDHIIGRNASPSANDEDLLAILADFWDKNKLDQRASEYTIQLFGFGEQCFPAAVRESDGRVRLGYVDPASIFTVEKHPDNALEDWAVVTEVFKRSGFTTEKKVYRIIREDEDFVDGDEVTQPANADKLVTHKQAQIQPWELEMLAEYDRAEYDGSCFYTKVNAVSNASRGMSDLLQVADWVEQADEVLFSLADRENMAGYFSFDVTYVGAGPDLVKQRNSEVRKNPPEKGSVNGHNDAEIWQMFSPDLHQTGSIETFRAILGLILGGMGYPVHWYGFGDDANRATATVQANPTEKTLEHDQAIVEAMFLQMCQFVADQAEIAGSYTAPDDLEITLTLPEVSSSNVGLKAQFFGQFQMALLNAQDAGWITQETAATAFSRLLAEVDVELDVIEELEKASAEQDEADLDQMASTNGQFQQVMATAATADNGDGDGTEPV